MIYEVSHPIFSLGNYVHIIIMFFYYYICFKLLEEQHS